MTGAGIGYWRPGGEPHAPSLVRAADGSTVAYAGATGPGETTRRWLGFVVSLPDRAVDLTVEQRIRGLDDGFRAWWYVVDLADVAAAGADTSESVVRLVVDALSSWEEPPFAAALPTGVAVLGAWVGPDFDAAMRRLYLPMYAASTPEGGSLTELLPRGAWRYRPVDPSVPAPALDRAATEGPAVRRAVVEAAVRRGPALENAGRVVVLPRGGLPGPQRIVYVDRELSSDQWAAHLFTSGHVELWSDGGILGTRVMATGLPPRAGRPRGLEGLVAGGAERVMEQLDRRQQRGRPGADTGRVSAATLARIRADVEDAMVSLVAVSPELPAMPRSVTVPSGIRRAGHLPMTCVVTKEVVRTGVARWDEQLANALDQPPPEPELPPGAGADFDGEAGVLTAPDGSTLVLESREGEGLTPRALRFRCRAAGLDWPVFVVRRDQRPPHEWSARPQSLNRWNVDHQACLDQWRAEGGSALPDSHRWDRLRQFLEDALLAWGDGPAAGPAPASIETFGGWYDGEWRDAGFRRLLGRPLTAATAVAPEWSPYEPGARWTTGAAAKQRADGARLFPAGFVIRHTRDGYEHRDYYTDFQHGGLRLRMPGVPEQLGLHTCWPVPADAPLLGRGDRLDEGLLGERGSEPSLRVWRELRDAAEGGLAPGQASDLQGAWILDRFHPRARRVTAWGVDLDFDNRTTW